MAEKRLIDTAPVRETTVDFGRQGTVTVVAQRFHNGCQRKIVVKRNGLGTFERRVDDDEDCGEGGQNWWGLAIIILFGIVALLTG